MLEETSRGENTGLIYSLNEFNLLHTDVETLLTHSSFPFKKLLKCMKLIILGIQMLVKMKTFDYYYFSSKIV